MNIEHLEENDKMIPSGNGTDPDPPRDGFRGMIWGMIWVLRDDMGDDMGPYQNPYHPPYHPSSCYIIPHIIPLQPYHPSYHPSPTISSPISSLSTHIITPSYFFFINSPGS